ncbi:hypothetical protein FIBSPDRAFT_814801 [Athelia psychrophila]|uniref:Uncharacterized protein n=1 Tax=Athelia psychrophila TaxID=1759441 RepID=A0A166TDP9_9AGAM|nr:hypothetical protein FIBSPDRAFT_814801 [Fibularhizoctonia sp. CBS 109695]
MPPQPGMFSVPHSSTHKAINQNRAEYPDGYHPGPGSSHAAGTSRSHESDARKEKKRKEFAGRLGKEMIDRRDECIHDRMKALHSASLQLSARPESSPLYNLRLYPLSLERSAMLVQSAGEERRGLSCVDVAYEEEKMRIEDEYLAGRSRIKERLLEGLEERRKKAREEKEGEGTSGDGTLDSQSRPHITRKLRNKLGASPPPASAAAAVSARPNMNGTTGTPPPLFSGALLNPNTLLVDEIPSPFPLPLVSSTPQTHDPLRYTVVFDPYYADKEEKKTKNRKGVVVNKNLHGLGPALKIFNGPDGGAGEVKANYRAIAREHEVEEDLFKLRRGTKRKRGAGGTAQ